MDGIVRNHNVKSVLDAIQFMEEIDFEQFERKGLSGKVICYLGTNPDLKIFDPNITAVYRGIIRIDGEQITKDTKNGELQLPYPAYSSSNGKDLGGFPLSLLTKNRLPGYLDVCIDISISNEFEFLASRILPSFVRAGYLGYNINHTSRAQMQLYESTGSNKKGELFFITDGEYTTIHHSILTAKENNRLASFKPNPKYNGYIC